MEYGIIVIKPDGLQERIDYLVEKEICAVELKVVLSYVHKFTYDQVQTIFTTTAFGKEEYYTYLAAGNMKVILVQGDYAIAKLRSIKYSIRKQFCCEKNMKNLLHTSDTGNEYKLQFQQLFPMLKYDEYPLFANMHVPFDEHMEQKVLEEKVYISGIIIDQNNIKNAYEKLRCLSSGMIGIRGRFEYANRILSAICYLDVQDNWYAKVQNMKFSKITIKDFSKNVKEVNGICIIDYQPFLFYNHDIISGLKTVGVDGFKVFDSRYSIEQIEKIRYFVQYRYKMLFTGGSSFVDKSLLTIDQETFENLSKRIRIG